MIQFNLLPAVKLEYIKAQRTKRLVIVGSVLAASISLLIFLSLLLNVNVLQKRHMSNLTNEIEENVAKLQEVENIDQVLTVQNQLNVLPSLHEKKPATDRVLRHLSLLTPKAAGIAQTTVNFEAATMTINGTSDSLVTVNKFVDTLKFTKFTSDGGNNEQNAFSNVVLSSFSVDDEQASYQIDLQFNPEIYDNTKSINLVVPNIISTRSQTEKPDDLFQGPANTGNQ